MKRQVTILLVIAFALTVVPGTSFAGQRRRAAASVTTRPATYGSRDARNVYPKYYGGFHYRQLDNVGVPTGDIGLRGNGWMMSPW